MFAKGKLAVLGVAEDVPHPDVFYRSIITKAQGTVKPRRRKFSAKKLTRFALCAILKGALSFGRSARYEEVLL